MEIRNKKKAPNKKYSAFGR